MKITIILLFMIISMSAALSQQRNENTTYLHDELPEIKILSWNIYMLPYIGHFNKNSERAQLIGEQLKNSDYQIVVFQEAFSLKCRNILRKKLKDKFPFQYGPANIPFFPLLTNSGLWVLSSIPLKQLKSICFKESTSFDRIARKGAVLFECEYHNTSFQLLTTHLQADNPGKIAAYQCKEVASLLHEFSRDNVPQLICGDFNTEMSDTINYNHMLKTLDAENGTLDGNIRSTYDEQNNSLAYRPNGKSEVIDYILTRNSHLIDRIQRCVKEFYSTDKQLHTHLSDHYAMEATVKFYNSPKNNISQQLHSEEVIPSMNYAH